MWTVRATIAGDIGSHGGVEAAPGRRPGEYDVARGQGGRKAVGCGDVGSGERCKKHREAAGTESAAGSSQRLGPTSGGDRGRVVLCAKVHGGSERSERRWERPSGTGEAPKGTRRAAVETKMS